MTYTGSLAQTGRGAVISITVASVVTPIGEVISWTPSGRSLPTEDVSNLESLSREFISTLPDEGEFEVVTNRVSSDAGQAAVEAAFEGGAKQTFTVVYPKTAAQTTLGDKYVYSAIVSEAMGGAITFDKKITYTFKVKISGAPTITLGS